MADVTPVALGIKVPDAMATLGSVMGVANAQQAYKTSQFDLAKKQATFDADVEQRKAESAGVQAESWQKQQEMAEHKAVIQMMKSGVDDKGDTIKNDNGEPDPSKLLPALGRVAPLTGQKYAQSILATNSAKVGLQRAATALGSEQRGVLMAPIQAIATNPSDPRMVEQAGATIDQWAQQHPEMAPIAKDAHTLLGHIASAKTPEARAHLANSMASFFQPGQQVQTQPQPASVTNGQQTMIGTTAPPIAGGGFSPASSVQQQLPPTTQTYNPETKAPELLGPQPVPGNQPPLRTELRVPPAAQASRDGDALRIVQEERAKMTDPAQIALADKEIARLSKTPVSAQFASRRVQTGPALGESGNIEGTVAANNKDFGETQEAASRASANIANLQKIKEYAKGATVGVAADRRALANGIGDLLGIPSSEIGKTNTDLLVKHANMLALTGGNTDSARILAEAANPNIHMNEASIRKAADYIIGLQKTALEKQKFLQPFKAMNDPNQYQSALKEWNANADPRVLQLLEMSPEEKKQMFGSMSPTEYAEFKRKALRLHEMGVGK